jgi:hypothetical protein
MSASYAVELMASVIVFKKYGYLVCSRPIDSGHLPDSPSAPMG